MAEWHYQLSDAVYTLIVELYRCTVWQDRSGRWAAFITNGQETRGHYPLLTADEAKAWCEAHTPAVG